MASIIPWKRGNGKHKGMTVELDGETTEWIKISSRREENNGLQVSVGVTSGAANIYMTIASDDIVENYPAKTTNHKVFLADLTTESADNATRDVIMLNPTYLKFEASGVAIFHISY
jgi:hypothetical protein